MSISSISNAQARSRALSAAPIRRPAHAFNNGSALWAISQARANGAPASRFSPPMPGGGVRGNGILGELSKYGGTGSSAMSPLGMIPQGGSIPPMAVDDPTQRIPQRSEFLEQQGGMPNAGVVPPELTIGEPESAAGPLSKLFGKFAPNFDKGGSFGPNVRLAMAAGLLGGGSTNKAVGRGFGNAFSTRKAALDAANKGVLSPEALKQKLEIERAGNPNSHLEPGSDAFDKMDEGFAAMVPKLFQDGMKAKSANMKIDRLETLLSRFQPGMEANIKSIAGDWGVHTKDLNPIQASQALINNLVPSQREEGSGPMSDADLDLFKAAMPRVINSEGGNAMIIRTLRGINEYSIARGEIARKVMNRQLTFAEGAKELYALPDPLAEFTGSYGGGTSQGAIDAGDKYIGGAG